ncbi:MAG: hypothetical protein RI985_2212 [Chloroflexota bacterium]|jgi:selenide,water dikinase
MGPGALSKIIAGLRFPQTDDNLLVGLAKADDAAVYQINATQALVQTVDFFPPIVDDPYDYGYIAATNSLSDVYAMGGRPMLALAIAAFPDNLPADVIQRILQGGIDAVAHAGAVAGGHTIVDPEPKYGLCVTGLIDPTLVAHKSAVQIGDQLFLSKPLGTGIITTAAKRNLCDTTTYATTVQSMKQLNRAAAELAMRHQVRSMTDITGFGLLGHAAEMVRDVEAALEIHAHALPLLPRVLEFARAGVVPGGLGRNRIHLLMNGLSVADELDPAYLDIAVDPQTSGGLLMAVAADAVAAFVADAKAHGIDVANVGSVEAGRGVALVI